MPSIPNNPSSVNVDSSQVEEWVASGIQKIHQHFDFKGMPFYDKQGILIQEFTKDDIDKNGWNKYFPKDLLANGLTVHIIKDENAKNTLPMRSMMVGKIRSLCQAAKKYTDNVENIENKIISEIEKKFRPPHTGELELSNDTLKKLLDEYIELSLHVLFACKNASVSKMSFSAFAKKVMKESKHSRTTNHDILVFDEAAGRFSYDHVVPGTTTAHDRSIGNQVANLGVSFDGSYIPENDHVEFKVTSSIVHHASLAPIETHHQSDLAILMDTCNHIEEVALKLAELKNVNPAEQKDTDINWCYQLLTTNFGNSEQQRRSYLHIAKAASLMDGAILDKDKTKIQLHMSLMNAGINKVHYAEYIQACLDPLNVFDGEKAHQNRKAYIHLTKSLQELEVPESIASDETVVQLKSLLAPDNKLVDNHKKLLKEMAINSSNFNQKRKIYNAIQDQHALNEGKNIEALQKKYNVTTQKDLEEALDKLIGNKLDKKALFSAIQDCITTSKKLNVKLNKVNQEIEKSAVSSINKNEINELIAALRNKSHGYNESEKTYISSLIFKAQMDDLYFSKEYYSPEKAVLFNAYTAAYQRLVGMSATTGCKSGNDRTYVLRLALAAIEGRDIDTILPPDYLNDQASYASLKKDFAKIAMSNSCLYTALNDTGGAPKVSQDKFDTFLQKTNQGELKIINVEKYGKYASHKLKPKNIKKNKDVIQRAKVIAEQIKNANQVPAEPILELAEDKKIAEPFFFEETIRPLGVEIANQIERVANKNHYLNNEELALSSHAIAECADNLKHWPTIETFEELIIAQQKREACAVLYEDYQRLLDLKDGESSENEVTGALKMKMDAYWCLKTIILNSDSKTMLSTIVAEDSKWMNFKVTRLINNKDQSRFYPFANVTIQDALYYKRGLTQATSKQHLDKLRNELDKVDPRTMYVKNINNDLLKQLMKMKNDYIERGRKTHISDINHLIRDIQLIMTKSDNPEIINPLIREKIQAAYDKEQRNFTKPLLGFFGNGKTEEEFAKKLVSKSMDYHYPRLLSEILEQATNDKNNDKNNKSSLA